MIRALRIGHLLLAAHTVYAAFTRPAYWRLDLIELTYAGTSCFHPGPDPASVRSCSNTTLTALLDAHTKNDHGPGLSIAYYDIKDRIVLGGATWDDWDDVVLPVGVCMSGAVNGFDNTYSTTCRFAIADDDQDIPSTHTIECTINRPQSRVTDGCYIPPPKTAGFRLSDTATAILTILGLLIVLPGIVSGTYRWYWARQALQEAWLEDGRALPLVPTSAGVVVSDVASRVPPLQGSATLEG